MNERTPVSAYRMFSKPYDMSIVFVSSRGTPCILNSGVFCIFLTPPLCTNKFQCQFSLFNSNLTFKIFIIIIF